MADEKKVQTQKTEQTFTKAEVQEMIRQAIADAKLNQPQTIVQVRGDEEVTLLFIDAVSKDTIIYLGDNLGQINRSGGTITVPKRAFLQGITPTIENLLAERKLIVVDGLTETERYNHNVLYTEGELLSEDMYFKLFDLSKDQMIKMYRQLCKEHKKIVAKMLVTGYFARKTLIEKGKVAIEYDIFPLEVVKRIDISQDEIQQLNEMTFDLSDEGLFSLILEDMGKNLVKKKR